MDSLMTADILREAATLIRRRGLSKGTRARTGDGLEIGVYVKSPAKRLCLEGAVMVTYENARLSGSIVNDEGVGWRSAVEEELDQRGLPPDIPQFNDEVGRTAEDVAELLTSVARTVTNHAKR